MVIIKNRYILRQVIPHKGQRDMPIQAKLEKETNDNVEYAGIVLQSTAQK